MSKRPAEQWYSGDWFRAVDVRKCSWATRGIWREMLDIMVNEQEPGKIRGTRTEICRLVGCSFDELNAFLRENKKHKFADVTFCNGNVTIKCRRLHRAYIERKEAKKRVRKHRQKKKRKSNGDVTPLSSSSTSLNTNHTNGDVTYSLQQVLDISALVGLHKRQAEEFFQHYQAQGWRFGNGQPIVDLQHAMAKWRTHQHRYNDKTKKKKFSDYGDPK